MNMTAGKIRLTAAEQFWYVVHNIAFGAAYFMKIPVRKALSDFGLTELTAAEHFWYIVMCLAFGAGYFMKIPAAKAISELSQYVQARETSQRELGSGETPPAITGGGL